MLDSWASVDADTLVYEKEALPVGENAKWTDGDEVEDIVIRRGYLDSLVRDFNKFKQIGIRVPLFKTHNEDPDNDRGTIQEVSVKPNKAGVDSLHLRVKFNDTKARDQGIHNDVSVCCPPKFIDQKKNVYKFPLRHVALTSVPVIPGLDPFTPLILSFDTPSGLKLSKESKMKPLDQLLADLGIKAEGSLDDAAKYSLIKAKLDSMVEKPIMLSFPPLVTNQMLDGRKAIIHGMVQDSILSVAMGTELEKEFCVPESITADLQLSREVIESKGTEFDRRVAWAKKLAANPPLKKSGRETLTLSRDGKEKDNPLVEATKKLAERAKQRA